MIESKFSEFMYILVILVKVVFVFNIKISCIINFFY